MQQNRLNPLSLYHGVGHGPNKPQIPLVKLAIRILSICPNSASCERLFSSFGLIMTKLRSRMSDRSLLGLAELKMHLRDEQTLKDIKKTLRKRAFGMWAKTNKESVSATESTNTQSTPEGVEDRNPSSGTSSTDTESTSDPRPATQLRELRDIFASMLELDSTDDYFVTTEDFGSRLNIRLDKLFDFESSSWVGKLILQATANLEDELEIYELLDLDAPGEESTAFDSGIALEDLITS